MYRRKINETAAKLAAYTIRNRLGIGRDEQIPLALVLGTGWGDVLTFEREIPFEEIPGFTQLEELPSHARRVAIGTIGGRRVVALRGRVHMNEAPPCDPFVPDMVRLQVEMLFHLGVERLVLTCAAGALDPKIETGSIVVLGGFLQPAGAVMPLYAGEFCSPEEALMQETSKLPASRMAIVRALRVAERLGFKVQYGRYAYWRGPHFEGLKDKAVLRENGGDIVGMSMLPEACIASLYEIPVLGVAFVTNNPFEPMRHETHQARAKEKAAKLGAFLEHITAALG